MYFDNRFIADSTRGLRKRLGFKIKRHLSTFAADASIVPEVEKQQTDLHRLFYAAADGPEIQKWRHYLSVYDRHLSRFRNRKPFRMLEIGVKNGGSLRLWRSYFGDDADIFGIDIDDNCRMLDGKHGAVRIGSQDDPEFLRKTISEMGGVDVVLDDGSHVASHQRISFDVLFPLLSPDGVYICEDLHTSYWRGEQEGGYGVKGTFIEFTKQIIDDIHADFHTRTPAVPNASRTIAGIHIYNSIAVIEKAPQSPPVFFKLGI